MKRIFKALIIPGLTISLLASVVACGKDNTSSDNTNSSSQASASTQQPIKNVTLSVWGSAFVSGDEQKKPQDQWELAKIFKKFEEANPGVKIELTLPADQAAAHNTYKAAALAKNGPDVVNLYSGTPLFALRDVVLHLDGKVPQEDLDNLNGWDTVRDNFQKDGAILAYPATGSEFGCFLYNKKLVANAGLDFEAAPPQNPDEFMAALEKIKATGVQPIVANDDGYNGLYVFTLGTWWAQMVGTEGISSDSMAKTKFVDDKAFIATMAKAAEIYKMGYVNKDYATAKDSGTRFNQGKAAILVTGNWGIADAAKAIGDDNVGILPVPQFSPDAKYTAVGIGGTGQSLAIANYTENPDLAIKLCSFINNKENTLSIVKVLSKIPLRKDITPAEMGWEGKPVYEKALKMSNSILYWTDNTQVPDVMNEYYKVGTLVTTGKVTPEKAAELLDKKAAEANK